MGSTTGGGSYGVERRNDSAAPPPVKLQWRGRRLTLVYLLGCGAVFGLLHLRLGIERSWVLAAAMAVAWIMGPHWARLAWRLGAVAQPGGRKTHQRATPLLGGAVAFVVVSGALLYEVVAGTPRVAGVLAGGTLVFGIGLLDDIRRVSPRVKIVVQVLAAGCLLASGFRITSLELQPLGKLELGMFGTPLVVLWILLATNAVNLVDGLDGLAASVALLAALTLSLVGIWPIALLALSGALLGFLYFNLPRARLYMGDAGSLFLGFVLGAAVLALPPARMVPLGLAVFAYPLGDVVLTLARRIIRGQPIWRPDRSHIHHKLVVHLGSHAPALLLVVLFSAVEILMALAYPGLPSVLLVLLGWAGIAALLVSAGQYSVNRALATREPIRRLHVVMRYARDSIRLASRPHDVETALQHLIEGIGVAHLELPAFEIELVNRLHDFDTLRSHHIDILKGKARWAEPRCANSQRVEIERETAVVEIVRMAGERLAGMTEDEHLTTVDKAAGALCRLRSASRAGVVDEEHQQINAPDRSAAGSEIGKG